MVRRRRVALDQLRQRPSRLDRRSVLLLVRPYPIAVLEVDPQVLDRLALKLGAYAVVDLGSVIGRQPQYFGQLGDGPTVLTQYCPSLLCPLADGAGSEAISWHVDGMDRLPHTTIAGVERRQGSIGIGQSPIQFGKQLFIH